VGLFFKFRVEYLSLITDQSLKINLLQSFSPKATIRASLVCLHICVVFIFPSYFVAGGVIDRAMIASLSVWLKIDDIFSFSDTNIALFLAVFQGYG
jgi:hypothetical protein